MFPYIACQLLTSSSTYLFPGAPFFQPSVVSAAMHNHPLGPSEIYWDSVLYPSTVACSLPSTRAPICIQWGHRPQATCCFTCSEHQEPMIDVLRD